MSSRFLKLTVCGLFIIILSWPLGALSRVIHPASLMDQHEQWMAIYGREYKDSMEKEKRYSIFKANSEYIDSVNSARNKSYKLAVNEYADLTNEEFKTAHISHAVFPERIKSTFRYENVTSIPPSIDWRQKGAVTPIRGGTCGGWAIPAVDTVEGITKINTGKLYTLSVQEIIDCDGGGHGCGGGFIEDAFEFIKQHGLTTETNYPPTVGTGNCDTGKEKEPVAKISGYKKVSNSETALLQAVANQPVAVMVDASGVDFQFYSSGVFTGKCGTVLNHGVSLVGYGTTTSGKLKYWIVKNSWGTKWGEDGYMRLQRGIPAKQGKCGIAMEGIFPTV